MAQDSLINLRTSAFIATTAILVGGTLYSVVYNTSLDTSNPLLTHLPHPRSSTDYFATKQNFLNVYFIKKAWAWTSAAFALLFFTSPPHIRTGTRFMKYITATALWLLFTSWFFGPALLERVIVASGGECVVSLPDGKYISVPQEFCFHKATVSPETHPDLFTSSFVLPDQWRGMPRLRKGHDVSGHIFLLTMSVLFLADQLKSSLPLRQWPVWHTAAVAFASALTCIWLFATYTTSVYFHTPFEKFTGHVLGVVGFIVTQLPSLWNV